MLHSVSARSVRACEMREVVTSYSYSVTRGEKCQVQGWTEGKISLGQRNIHFSADI